MFAPRRFHLRGGALAVAFFASASVFCLNLSARAEDSAVKLFQGNPTEVGIFDVVLALAYTFPGIDTPEQAVEFANVLLARDVSLNTLSPLPTKTLLAGLASPADTVSIADVLVLLAQTFPGNSSPEAIAAFANALTGPSTLSPADVLASGGLPNALPVCQVSLPSLISESALNIRFQILPAPSGDAPVIAGGIEFPRVNVPGSAASYANLSASTSSFSSVTLPSTTETGSVLSVLDGTNAVLAEVTVGNCGGSSPQPTSGPGTVSLSQPVQTRPALDLRFEIEPAPIGDADLIVSGVTFVRVDVPGETAFYASLTSEVVATFSQVTLPAGTVAGTAIRVLDGQNTVLATATLP